MSNSTQCSSASENNGRHQPPESPCSYESNLVIWLNDTRAMTSDGVLEYEATTGSINADKLLEDIHATIYSEQLHTEKH